MTPDVWIGRSDRSHRIGFQLLGDSKPAPYSSGAYPWTVIDRPRRKPFTEFNAVQLMQLDLPLMLDRADSGHSVETDCATVDSWRYVDPGLRQPPTLRVSGPVAQYGVHDWVLMTVGWAEAIRRVSDGQRIQQTVTLTLVEYASNDARFLSPAQAIQVQQQAPGTTAPPPGGRRRHWVRWGDTLSQIAAAELGDYRRWPEIASLNNIRDPRSLQANTWILLP